ncbi:methyltransferase domain-containing protein [Ferrimonas marina]|uniref:Methyltransferase domain-containing protein n=1 Tax=Ferrimonas marina TaxID=299255 RepID=A0A1M5U6G8_9GAMM|nr:hypothetical protein [Ferrimonas marina]SHH58539.1 hypothetical protein SAMN02745129_2427 [Ferrimonas marina]
MHPYLASLLEGNIPEAAPVEFQKPPSFPDYAKSMGYSYDQIADPAMADEMLSLRLEFQKIEFDHALNSGYAFELKQSAATLGAYSTVTKPLCAQVAARLQGKRVLEIGAGRGFMAKGLAECGIEVTATDSQLWDSMPAIYDVKQMGMEEAVKAHGPSHDVLMVIWPFRRSPLKAVFRAWHALKGEKAFVVYCGEDGGGATAGYAALSLLEPVESLLGWIDYPTSPYLKDDIGGYRVVI